MNKTVKQRYQHREEKYRAFATSVEFRLKRIIRYKLIAIFGGLGISLSLFLMHFYYLGSGVLGCVLILYLYLNARHDKAGYYRTLCEHLIAVNETGTLRSNGAWTSFRDKGAAFSNPDHDYSEDLDITGQSSVFQYINSCTTPWGRERLKSILLTHPDSIEEIIKRQKAVCELSKNLTFRQRLIGEGMSLPDQSQGTKTLLELGHPVNTKLLDKHVQFLFRLLPAMTIPCILLGYWGVLPSVLPVLLILVQIGLLLWKSKERKEKLDTAYKLKYQLGPLLNMLKLAESRKFTAPLLTDLQKSLIKNNALPSKQLKKLSDICGNISNRNNMFYFLFNILTLWDYQCEIALEKWKHAYGRYLADWLESIGMMEALSSLANLRFENPDWTVPEIKDSEPLFIKAGKVGHPLISKGRVDNDFELGGRKKVVLVTGSNMSGKSTFLRTIGLNLILAYAGAPVCAKSFSCSMMHVFTCMRVSDNLEKNISGFYAELLRIKRIVDAVENKGRVFFLLDEIFKGTNSYDRHDAARILIKKLAKKNTVGLVSTHDLELEVLEKETGGQIVNYHFQEHFEKDQILFDYRLLPGVSKTRNAKYLIKTLGIDLE